MPHLEVEQMVIKMKTGGCSTPSPGLWMPFFSFASICPEFCKQSHRWLIWTAEQKENPVSFHMKMCPTSLLIQILIIPISRYIVGTFYMPSWLLTGLISNRSGLSSLQTQSPVGKSKCSELNDHRTESTLSTSLGLFCSSYKIARMLLPVSQMLL